MASAASPAVEIDYRYTLEELKNLKELFNYNLPMPAIDNKGTEGPQPQFVLNLCALIESELTRLNQPSAGVSIPKSTEDIPEKTAPEAEETSKIANTGAGDTISDPAQKHVSYIFMQKFNQLIEAGKKEKAKTPGLIGVKTVDLPPEQKLRLSIFTQKPEVHSALLRPAVIAVVEQLRASSDADEIKNIESFLGKYKKDDCFVRLCLSVLAPKALKIFLQKQELEKRQEMANTRYEDGYTPLSIILLDILRKSKEKEIKAAKECWQVLIDNGADLTKGIFTEQRKSSAQELNFLQFLFKAFYHPKYPEQERNVTDWLAESHEGKPHYNGTFIKRWNPKPNNDWINAMRTVINSYAKAFGCEIDLKECIPDITTRDFSDVRGTSEDVMASSKQRINILKLIDQLLKWAVDNKNNTLMIAIFNFEANFAVCKTNGDEKNIGVLEQVKFGATASSRGLNLIEKLFVTGQTESIQKLCENYSKRLPDWLINECRAAIYSQISLGLDFEKIYLLVKVNSFLLTKRDRDSEGPVHYLLKMHIPKMSKYTAQEKENFIKILKLFVKSQLDSKNKHHETPLDIAIESITVPEEQEEVFLEGKMFVLGALIYLGAEAVYYLHESYKTGQGSAITVNPKITALFKASSEELRNYLKSFLPEGSTELDPIQVSLKPKVKPTAPLEEMGSEKEESNKLGEEENPSEDGLGGYLPKSSQPMETATSLAPTNNEKAEQADMRPSSAAAVPINPQQSPIEVKTVLAAEAEPKTQAIPTASKMSLSTVALDSVHIAPRQHAVIESMRMAFPDADGMSDEMRKLYETLAGINEGIMRLRGQAEALRERSKEAAQIVGIDNAICKLTAGKEPYPQPIPTQEEIDGVHNVLATVLQDTAARIMSAVPTLMKQADIIVGAGPALERLQKVEKLLGPFQAAQAQQSLPQMAIESHPPSAAGPT